MELFLIAGSALFFVGILLSPVALRTGAPLLLFFLAIGMLVGEDGPGSFDFNNFNLAYDLGSIALAVILFTGGLETQFSDIKKHGHRPSCWRASVYVSPPESLVALGRNDITIDIKLMPQTGETEMSVRHVVPARIRRRGVEMRLVLESEPSKFARQDPALIKALARAHRWFDDLASGRARSFRDIARCQGVSDRYVSHLLPLAFLAPDIVEAILAGTQPVDLTAETLIKRTDLPLGWADQKDLLGFD